MSRKKKCIIFLVVIALLFLVSTGAGFMREEDGMTRAMRKVKRMVAQARADIRKEMEKPFILRLFGSLFGMEGNKFQKLKEDLPKVIKSAMPKSIGKFSNSSKSNEIACEGMRLSDALLLIRKKNVKLEKLRWTFKPDIQDKKYILLSGTVITATQSKTGITLTIQMWHGFSGEDGLLVGDNGAEGNLDKLKQQEALARAKPQPLRNWYPYEDKTKRSLALPPALLQRTAEHVEADDG